MENDLVLHAVVESVKSSRKPKGGRTYTLTFSYPRAYLHYVDEFYDLKADLYWNEELIASSADVKSMRQKKRKGEDPLYLVDFDCDGADTAIKNMANLTDTAGDLRVAITQMVLNVP